MDVDNINERLRTALDGREIENSRGRWQMHGDAVHEGSSGEHWVQLTITGQTVYQLVLRLTPLATLDAALVAIRAWLNDARPKRRLLEI